MMQSTLSRLLAIALRMHQTLTYCSLDNQCEYRLWVQLNTLSPFGEKIYSIVIEDKELLRLFLISKINCVQRK